MLRQKCICVGVKAYFFSSRFGKGHIDKTKGGILVDWGKKERKKECFQIRIYLASYSDVGVGIPCLMFSISGILFSTDVWLATDRRFSPISTTNKTDRHDLAELLFKVALNTIKQNQTKDVLSYYKIKIVKDVIWSNKKKYSYQLEIRR